MSDEDPYLSPAERAVNDILEKTAGIIEAKYGIKPCGEGAGMPGGVIQHFGLSFDARGPYTKQHLRKLLVDCAYELLQIINNNEKVRPQLEKFPFTLANIQVIIYNHDASGRRVFDPEISVAEIAKDGLTYQGVDPDDRFRYKSEFRETYEEALEILRRQQP